MEEFVYSEEKFGAAAGLSFCSTDCSDTIGKIKNYFHIIGRTNVSVFMTCKKKMSKMNTFFVCLKKW